MLFWKLIVLRVFKAIKECQYLAYHLKKEHILILLSIGNIELMHLKTEVHSGFVSVPIVKRVYRKLASYMSYRTHYIYT